LILEGLFFPATTEKHTNLGQLRNLDAAAPRRQSLVGVLSYQEKEFRLGFLHPKELESLHRVGGATEGQLVGMYLETAVAKQGQLHHRETRPRRGDCPVRLVRGPSRGEIEHAIEAQLSARLQNRVDVTPVNGVEAATKETESLSLRFLRSSVPLSAALPIRSFASQDSPFKIRLSRVVLVAPLVEL
jgi:hypothetical protein